MYNILYILIRNFGSSRVTGAHSVAPLPSGPPCKRVRLGGCEGRSPYGQSRTQLVRRLQRWPERMPEETATGARFLRAILPASGGPGPTAGSVDPGLRIAFFRHFGPSRSEVQLHLVFRRTRGTVVPRRPKVHFMVGENTISFADVAPASVLAWPLTPTP